MEVDQASKDPNRSLLAFIFAVPIAILGGLIGLGGAEFRLPVLVGVLRYTAKQAVPLNLAVSLITIITSLVIRANPLPLEALNSLGIVIFSLIDGLSHLIPVYVFHRLSGYELLAKPFLDDQVHGIFATRYPFRPNPIGLSVVRLVERRDNELLIDGIDVLDGTPLIDIKPYVTEFDVRTDVRIGWYEARGVKP